MRSIASKIGQLNLKNDRIVAVHFLDSTNSKTGGAKVVVVTEQGKFIRVEMDGSTLHWNSTGDEGLWEFATPEGDG